MDLDRKSVWAIVAVLAILVLSVSADFQHTETRRGHVRDQQGRPVAGATVHFFVMWDSLEDRRFGYDSYAHTDADGAFEISTKWTEGVSGDAPGPFGRSLDLEVCHRDFIPAAFVGREHSGQEKGDIDFALARRPKASEPYAWSSHMLSDAERECRIEFR